MTLYAPSDVRSITVHLENGGCGRPHEAPPFRNPGEKLSITCPPCEAWLMAHPSLGWSSILRNVQPTCDERAALQADTATTDQAISGLMGVFAKLAGQSPAALPASRARAVEAVTASAPAESASESAPEGTATVAVPAGFGDFSDEALAAVEARIAKERALRKLTVSA